MSCLAYFDISTAIWQSPLAIFNLSIKNYKYVLFDSFELEISSSFFPFLYLPFVLSFVSSHFSLFLGFSHISLSCHFTLFSFLPSLLFISPPLSLSLLPLHTFPFSFLPSLFIFFLSLVTFQFTLLFSPFSFLHFPSSLLSWPFAAHTSHCFQLSFRLCWHHFSLIPLFSSIFSLLISPYSLFSLSLLPSPFFPTQLTSLAFPLSALASALFPLNFHFILCLMPLPWLSLRLFKNLRHH